MKLAFIIPTFNRSKFLFNLLSQINLLEKISGVDIVVIVINDGSTDDTELMIKNTFPGTILITGSGNWWWTKCMNAGFIKAMELEQDCVLVMNDDVELKADYLKILLKDYKELPEKSILGSASVSSKAPHRIESAGTGTFKKWKLKFVPYFKNFEVIREDFHGIHKTWTLSGRGTLIPVCVFKLIGFYDERLPQYGSDDEFCIRANMKQLPVYISWNARVYNHTNLTSPGSVIKKDGIFVLLKSFFNRHSSNSLQKNAYLYWKYGFKCLTPVYMGWCFLGTLKAYYFNYRK